MKSPTLFAILLLAACASPGDLIDERTLDCGPGQDISIAAGIDWQQIREDGRDEQFELLVEVSNNSHHEVTVTAIRVAQRDSQNARFLTENAYRKFDQVIEEGKDHTFHLPMMGRGMQRDSMGRQSVGRPALELAVTVVLASGDSYRCLFDVGTSR